MEMGIVEMQHLMYMSNSVDVPFRLFMVVAGASFLYLAYTEYLSKR